MLDNPIAVLAVDNLMPRCRACAVKREYASALSAGNSSQPKSTIFSSGLYGIYRSPWSREPERDISPTFHEQMGEFFSRSSSLEGGGAWSGNPRHIPKPHRIPQSLGLNCLLETECGAEISVLCLKHAIHEDASVCFWPRRIIWRRGSSSIQG